MKANSILIGPVLTEKATKLAQSQVYMFRVSKNSNKNQIKKVLEDTFKVEIASIRSSNRKGKTIRRGRRMAPRKLPDQRVVYVKVKKGKIDIFPQT